MFNAYQDQQRQKADLERYSTQLSDKLKQCQCDLASTQAGNQEFIANFWRQYADSTEQAAGSPVFKDKRDIILRHVEDIRQELRPFSR